MSRGIEEIKLAKCGWDVGACDGGTCTEETELGGRTGTIAGESHKSKGASGGYVIRLGAPRN